MAKPVASTKGKKKKWFSILAPKMFGGAIIGETIVYDVGLMKGKTITQNPSMLMNLPSDAARVNANVKFEVTGVQDDKATTSVIAYNMMPSTIKRLVR